MTSTDRFHALHQGPDLLQLSNVWDAASALLAQEAGATALATSSASLCWSLGYADGGFLPWPEHLAAVQRILRVARVPLSVDIENGYSDEPERVAQRVLALAELGVAGINLEDGTGPVELLAAKISAIRQQLAGRTLFINARTDTYLAAIGPEAQREAETLRRLLAYAEAGADGVFVPALLELEVAQRLARACLLPLNLMAMPGLPPPAELQAAGVRRLSQGPGPFLRAYGAFAAAIASRSGPGAPPGLSAGRMNALALAVH